MKNGNPFTYEEYLEYAETELGLKHTTSKIQMKNQTIEFFDSFCDCYYTLHGTGYIRRKIKNIPTWDGAVKTVSYQLNPTKSETRGDTFRYRHIERILFPGNYEKLFELLENSVANYRDGKGYTS